MCFAPQRRALFRHLNFQKWSDNGVLSKFWLGHVLRATMAKPTFRPPEPQIIGKTHCFATLLPFRAPFLSSHSFSSLIFSLLLFSSLTRPTSAFPSVQIVGGLTSKLPSIIHTHKLMINLFTYLLHAKFQSTIIPVLLLLHLFQCNFSYY